MQTKLPSAVHLPFQALVDDAVKPAVRLTLCLLYGFADGDGMVRQTSITLAAPRELDRNSVRRHLLELVKHNFIVPIHSALKVDVPQRQYVDGYMLTLRPDGSRYPCAHRTRKIGGKWDRKAKWV